MPMNDKRDVLQIIGALMKEPTLLSKTDKYSLSITDFSTRFYKYLFGAIDVLYHNGADIIDVIDIENFLESNSSAKIVFEQEHGVEFLQDAIEFSDPRKFDYYYNHLKKINTLRDLNKLGIDTKQFYCEDLTSLDALEINQNFETLSIQEIIDTVKKKIVKVEQEYLHSDVTETQNAFDGIRELIEESKLHLDVGRPLQGEIFNEVMSGARKGTLTIRSAGSGVGKSRNMVGDACLLAFPIRFDQITQTWEKVGSCEKVLYIATEQTRKEIQRMILAYLTGINESKFRFGYFTDREQQIIEQALIVLEEFKDNLQITQMPNPTNELIKTIIREEVLLHEVEYVFYDYIFIGPALLNEFKGFALRNDELLLMLSTTLKDLAAELNVFIMTATQLNAHGDDNSNIKNESALAGGRSTINKADYGFIMSRPTKEELEALQSITEEFGFLPTQVTDVFKVRSGEWTQLRIWSIFDLGTLRKRDLFITDSRLDRVNMSFNFSLEYETDIDKIAEVMERMGV